MEKRYQVFVSSTFTDLIEERRAVMQALLELNCIPAGMELFPASSDDQWTLIQRVIDDCDYYLVILGGRYGSMDPQGVSYTEKEFDYAVKAGKPVMGFVHRQPGDIPARFTDRDPAVAAKMDAFRSKVQQRMCKFWANADELGAIVSRSCVLLVNSRPAEGWVKFRYAKNTEELEKVNQMHEQIRVLEQELARLRARDDHVPANLARGQDEVILQYTIYPGGEPARQDALHTTWNEVFSVVGLLCMDLPTENAIEVGLNTWIRQGGKATVSISPKDLARIKIQFFSLGLIRTEMILRASVMRYSNQEMIADPPQPEPGWVLTEDGRRALGELLAEKRPAAAASSTARG